MQGDVPAPGDYDGDGKGDIAVWRPSSRVWWVLTSSSNFTTLTSKSWGLQDWRCPGGGSTDDSAADGFAALSQVWYVVLE